MVEYILGGADRLARSLAEGRALWAIAAVLMAASVLATVPYGLLSPAASPWKIATLFTGSLLICFPCLYVFGQFLGFKLDLAQNLAPGPDSDRDRRAVHVRLLPDHLVHLLQHEGRPAVAGNLAKPVGLSPGRLAADGDRPDGPMPGRPRRAGAAPPVSGLPHRAVGPAAPVYHLPDGGLAGAAVMRRSLAYILIGSALYGFAIGSSHSFRLGGRNVVKFPLLILATSLICSLAYYVLAKFISRRGSLSFADVIRLALRAFGDTSVLLASLSPVCFFLARSMVQPDEHDLHEYPLFLGLNVLFIALCGDRGRGPPGPPVAKGPPHRAGPDDADHRRLAERQPVRRRAVRRGKCARSFARARSSIRRSWKWITPTCGGQPAFTRPSIAWGPSRPRQRHATSTRSDHSSRRLFHVEHFQ